MIEKRKKFSYTTAGIRIAGIVLSIIVIAVTMFLFYIAIKETPKTNFDKVLEPIPDKSYITTAKLLKDNTKYRSGINVNRELKKYLQDFTANNYSAAAVQIIHWQDQLNGLDLRNMLAIDTVLSKSLEKAARNVRVNKENIAEEEQSCGIFNGLLNPSLLVMDLTLWTGKSQIYPMLQQYQDVGVQCLFYYPQLSHGMFTYDVRTGRVVQRSVFCDPSENKSKCFGVWDYFWKFAVDPVKGPINYGVGCSLTDWMNQGFVCVNGIDLKSDSSGKLMRSSLLFSVEGDQIGIVNTDVKDEFQNALGANGKTIIDNVKQKCAKVKEKSSKYGSIVPTLTEAGSSLTGGVISTATAISNTGEGLQEEYEKAMLFASLFSEACAANPSDLAKDLAGGGGAGQFGLNKPNACILSDVKEISSNELQAEKACLDNFFGPRGLEQVQNLNGLPDNRCMPSVSQSGSQCTDISCLLLGGDKRCGSDGTKCGREPTKQEEKYLKNAGAGAVGEKWRVVDTRKEIDETCGRKQGASAAACSIQSTKTAYVLKENIKASPKDPTTAPSPKGGGKVYTFQALVKHEQNHITKDDPNKNEEQNEYDRQEEDKSKDKNFVKPKSKEPTPDGLEPDECSAQSRKIDTLADCLDQAQMQKFVKKPIGLAPGTKGPSPDPAPPGDEVGGTSVPACDETRESGGAGGYFGTKKNSADDCLIGDFCDFAQWAGASSSAAMNKKCQMVQVENEKLPCPPLQ